MTAKRCVMVGVDGGTEHMGLAVVAWPPDELLSWKQADLPASWPADRRFGEMARWLFDAFTALRGLGVTHAAIEDVYLGRKAANVRTALALGAVVGMVRCAARIILDLSCSTVPHMTAKLALTGSGRATKEGVMRAVMYRYFCQNDVRSPAEFGITEHWADAVAVCHGALRRDHGR